MLNDDQINIYQNEGLIKSPTCLSEQKVKELNDWYTILDLVF